MPFRASEAKLLRALAHAKVAQTVDQLAAATGLSARTISGMLPDLAYQGMTYEEPAGWQISLRGRAAIAPARYSDV